MHYMDSNKTAGEETKRQLHKNATSNLEQVLAAKLFKLDEPHMQDTAGEAGTNS